ncbi:hypothetical protein SJAG_01701 [Schizosaccharomyces japonicus yFS275]|uniref:Uncharacterized protein n=1 Tax=Schizosaccharomyces japonicus (strain yFS275 / FY16936) TaxID=402676 RepID=B6JYN4_SCHJY|nr:hypothetical protein SJAG_01701 [Schizosaccharomyces japonicus yFS275]EEB06652.1 hypothetical protein SJAG_01701 [Schizosaccharomyces japonicus yFS275]
MASCHSLVPASDTVDVSEHTTVHPASSVSAFPSSLSSQLDTAAPSQRDLPTTAPALVPCTPLMQKSFRLPTLPSPPISSPAVVSGVPDDTGNRPLREKLQLYLRDPCFVRLCTELERVIDAS